MRTTYIKRMASILISGASVAGPTLAYWLRRAGHDVTVVERAPAIRRGGYAIDVRGAALEVAERMGILEAMRRQATDTLSTTFVDHRGRRVATFDRGFGVLAPSDVEIMRGDLAAMLYELTRDDVRYELDDLIVSLTQDAHGVRVGFARQREARFDLVIGADGLHSRVRALAFPATTDEPAMWPLGGAIAIFSARNHPRLERAQLMMMAPGRVASVKSDRGNATVKVTLLFSSSQDELGRAADGPDAVDAQRRAVAAAFGSIGGPLPALLDDMWRADDFYCVMTNQVRMRSWHTGRVALVGDAAYCPSPMTGQGTSLAMIGAYALARALGNGRDPAAGLASYERAMREFVARNQEVARGAARSFAPASAFGAWFRNLNLRLLPYLPWRDAVLRLAMRDIARAATAKTLDELAPPPSPGLAACSAVA
jgi:2-polyprenyl-6-methoxyphenol hydroxylase-like FAD-dependent oxidoreductase